MLSVIFASLLLGVFMFIDSNSKRSLSTLIRLQAISLAEAGNARAISRMNIRTLPTVEDEDDDEDDDDFDDDDDDDFFDDEDEFFEEELFDEDDEDDLDEDDFDDDEEIELESIPRYINFYQKHPFYVNVDTGQIVTEGGYYNLVARQREAIARAKAQGRQLDPQILVERLYLPLPEVNVERIGTIPIPKGSQLKEGFTLVLAEQVPVLLKQQSILEEYFNVFPGESSSLKTKISSISPNYGEPDDIIDISVIGENLDSRKPSFSSGNLKITSESFDSLVVEINEDTKIGRYKLKWGGDSTDFYVIPPYRGGELPNITSVTVPGGSFETIRAGETIKGIQIIGENLGSPDNPPVIVPTGKNLKIDVNSVSPTNVSIDISAKRAIPGSYGFTLFNRGGDSNQWLFRILEKKADQADEQDPDIGTYSTVLTLVGVKSLSNLGLGQTEQPRDKKADISGRPDKNKQEPGTKVAGGRPGDEDQVQRRRPNLNFNLLKSDLETIWKAETIATVNKVNYKVTSIINRKIPNVKAALTTNASLSFGKGDLKIFGFEQASTTLNEGSGSEDTEIVVIGPTKEELERLREDFLRDKPPAPTGSAVIEDLGIGLPFDTPKNRGFRKGGLIAILAPTTGTTFSDFGYIKSIGTNTITIEEPGFEFAHFQNDQVVQFLPSVISPHGINRIEAERHLVPSASFIPIPKSERFDIVFGTRVEDIENWTNATTTDTKVPLDTFEGYEGYFGLNIVEGVPNYDGLNALVGEGVLIVDTTARGTRPPGTVRIGGNSKLPSIFDGVIYINGNLNITGDVDISGAIVVNAPSSQGTIDINGNGSIRYSELSLLKSVIGLPFTPKLHGLKIEKSGKQEAFLKSKKDSRRRRR